MDNNNQLSLAEVVIRAAKVRDGETEKEALERVKRFIKHHVYAYSSWGHVSEEWTYGHSWDFTDNSMLVVDANDNLSIQFDIDLVEKIKTFGGFHAIGRSLEKLMEEYLDTWTKNIFDYLQDDNEPMVEIEIDPADIEVEVEYQDDGKP